VDIIVCVASEVCCEYIDHLRCLSVIAAAS